MCPVEFVRRTGFDGIVPWPSEAQYSVEAAKRRAWFKVISNHECGCLQAESCHMGNREYAFGRGLRSCLECGEYPFCERTEYQRSRYPYVIESFRKVQEEGLESWLEEKDRRARQGVDMCARMLKG